MKNKILKKSIQKIFVSAKKTIFKCFTLATATATQVLEASAGDAAAAEDAAARDSDASKFCSSTNQTLAETGQAQSSNLRLTAGASEAMAGEQNLGGAHKKVGPGLNQERKEDLSCDFSAAKGHVRESEEKDVAISTLVDMGYQIEDVLIALERCGNETPIEVLVDFICAVEIGKVADVPEFQAPIRTKACERHRQRLEIRERTLESSSRKQMFRFGVPVDMENSSSKGKGIMAKDNSLDDCWDTDDELEIELLNETSQDRDSASSSGSCSYDPTKVDHFVSMGFKTDLVVQAIKEFGEDNDDAILDSVLTYSEEHCISTPHFAWPQVSCMSGFPTWGSLLVLASYVDSSDERQKYAVRFSRISDVEEFITSLENILSNKIPTGCQAVDVVPAISSQSEVVASYRPDTSSMKTPICGFTSPKNLHNEEQQDSFTQDTVADSQSNVDTFPPRFTSLVSSCSAEIKQGTGELAMPLPLSDVPQNTDLKAQISKYMQDASFLDIVNKVNEVITELGGDLLM